MRFQFVFGLASVLLELMAGPMFAQTAGAQYELGLSALKKGDLDGAITHVRRAVAIQPEYPEAHNTLGLLLGKKGTDALAVINEFQTALRQRPDFAEAHYNLGLVLAQLGQVDPCIAEFREAVRYKSDYPEAWNGLGLALFDRNIDEAIGAYEKALKLRPGFIEVEFNLALAYRRKYGVDREIEQLRRVLALDRTHMFARNTLARRLEELNRIDELVALATETVRMHPNSAEAHYFLGKGLLKSGDAAAAIGQFQRAIALDPELGEAHHNLGMALRRVGRGDEAGAALEKAATLRDKQHQDISANIQMSEAELNLKNGNFEKAIADLKEVTRLQPEWPDAFWQLGAALEKKGDLDDAIAAFEQAVKLRPGTAQARYELALVLREKGDLDRAVDELRRVIALSPSLFEAHLTLGAILLNRNEGPSALAELKRAVELNDKSPEAQYLLGVALNRAGQNSAAQQSFAKTKTMRMAQDGRTEAASELDLGLKEAKAGNLENAVQHFREAVKLAPDLPQAYQFLGTALISQEHFDAAIVELNHAVQLKPDYYEAYYNLAVAYRGKGDSEAARAAYARARELGPRP